MAADRAIGFAAHEIERSDADCLAAAVAIDLPRRGINGQALGPGQHDAAGCHARAIDRRPQAEMIGPLGLGGGNRPADEIGRHVNVGIGQQQPFAAGLLGAAP